MSAEVDADWTIAADPRDLPSYDELSSGNTPRPETAGSADRSPIDPLAATAAELPAMPAAPTAKASPYVHREPVRHTVEPINDFAPQGAGADPLDSSGLSSSTNITADQGYRSSRGQGTQLRRNLHYGQYLEIPQGRRDIFVKRERRSRIKTFIALVAVLAVIAVVIYFLWEYMQVNWGRAGISGII